ncbi:hypothetical protein GYB22_05530 [bacterium]|nr:hypothetical protein [bacterium]
MKIFSFLVLGLLGLSGHIQAQWAWGSSFYGTVQNSLLAADLLYSHNTDLKGRVELNINQRSANRMHEFGLGVSGSTIRIQDSAYIQSSYLFLNYSFLRQQAEESPIYIGFGGGVMTSFYQARTNFNTLEVEATNGFGAVIKTQIYLDVRYLFEAYGYKNIPAMGYVNWRIGTDFLGIRNFKGTENEGMAAPVYYMSIGFGVFRNFRNN